MAAPANTEVIDLQGKMLLPSFTDTHTHFVELAKQRLQLDLTGCGSIGEVIGRIDAFIQKTDPLPEWVLGGGWDLNRLADPGQINASLLDRFFPDTPVALFGKDYHSKWCNTKALQIAGLTQNSSDPSGGKLGRDATGKLTGILYETAAELLYPFEKPPGRDQISLALRETIPEIHRLGITAVHTMESRASYEILQELVLQNHGLRVCWHFPLEELQTMIADRRSSYSGDEWLKLGGVKIFADGSLGSQTAAIFTDYPSSPGNQGILRYSEEELYQLAAQAEAQGICTTIHAIGVRAVRTVINAYLRFHQAQQGQPCLRRIEHLQSIAPEDIPLLRQCGAWCALQPAHLANDIDLIETHWPQIRDQAYTFKSLQEEGIPFGFGSDAPIETINPFHGIYSAIARRKGFDPKAEAWFSGQCLGVWEALYAYTLGAAQGSDSQAYRGSITPGKAADLIALDDFTGLEPEFWLDARSRLTMLEGRIVWEDL